MPVRPWSGFVRGLLLAMLPRPVFGSPAAAPSPPWLAAAAARRRFLLASLLVVALLAAWLAAPGTAPVQWLLQAGLLAWVALGLVTALMGAWVLLRGDRHALRLRNPHAPIDKAARTALIMPICNEDISTVFGGLRATCESLAATGAMSLFDVYVLSDSSNAALRAAEVQAWERLRAVLGDDGPVQDGGRVFYRWRRRRTRRKAGNVADFCRRWGGRYRYMVVLDADSTMSGATLLDLVRLMEQHPRAGIVQTLPQPGGHVTLHARLQQFTSRVTGRLFALGLAFWQLGDSHYWGHNAILRVEPFMRHCALPPLRGRGGLAGEILSHDFVEAAMMRRAGYEVWLAPQLRGSWEQVPPNLLAELQRDRRWCQGNLQNARLIAEPGWRPAHRAMFGAAALSYAVAPLWLVFVGMGLWLGKETAWQGHGSALWLLTAVLLLAPRALGLAAVLGAREQAQYGGTPKLLASALLEALLSALQAPLRMLAHSLFVAVALTGLKLGWISPPRDAAHVRWRDAAAGIGVLAAPALLVMALAVVAASPAVLWTAPMAGLWLPLLLAVPCTVVTGSVAVGLWARRVGLLATPEERRPPRPLQRAAEASGFGDLHSPAPPAAAMAPFGPPRAALALGVAVVALLGVLPRPGVTPGFSPELVAAWAPVHPPMTAESDLASDSSAPAVRALPRYRPAQRIDAALRLRATKAVERALAEEDYERLIWSLARAAAIAD